MSPLLKSHDGDGYTITFPSCDSEFIADRLRWEKDDLYGQLSIATGIIGARTTAEGFVSFGTFNFSNPRARRDRAKEINERVRAKLDWVGMLDQACILVLKAERHGSPSVSLRDVAKPSADDEYEIAGF